MPISNIAINGQVISTSLWTQASNKVTISIPTNLSETVGIQITNGASPQLPLISCSTAVTPSATTTPPATVPPTTVPPTTTAVASITADSMAFDIYYNMNSATLDSKNRAIIKAKYRELRSKLNSNTQVIVKVTGWVQPTIISPNVRGLSIWRAKSVVQYMQSLGLKAKYTIQAPGHEKVNIAQSRRASVAISWGTSK
jgi:outer membrane protein OmpA-like peptidoglycan-associated protein